MTSRREKTPVKKMRRLALVICEGEITSILSREGISLL